jgi:hypothetical protein
MCPPWHFTTLLDLVDHWQTLLAGGLALVAGLITVRVIREQIETAVRLERERVASEVDALRKSLAVELRLHIATALVAYDGLSRLGFMPGAATTARKVERTSRMAAPIIYPANAGKIGLLGADATDVMIVYDRLEDARDRSTRFMTPRTGDDGSAVAVMETADAFLTACEYARGLLPRLRSGDPSLDAKDEVLTQKINAALAARRA